MSVTVLPPAIQRHVYSESVSEPSSCHHPRRIGELAQLGRPRAPLFCLSHALRHHARHSRDVLSTLPLTETLKMERVRSASRLKGEGIRGRGIQLCLLLF